VLSDLRYTVFRFGWARLASVAESDVIEIASWLGRPVPRRGIGSVLDAVRPRPVGQARPNTMSAHYGLGAFPFHTEAAYSRVPPRFVLLYLANEDSSRRPTLLHDIRLLAVDHEQRVLMTREVWVVKSGRLPFLTSILSSDTVAGQEIVRFDRHCMIPAAPFSGAAAVVLNSLFE